MRAIVALLLATMLLRAEANGLADQRINQGVKQAVAALSGNRPVVLARAVYSNSAAGQPVDQPVMESIIPPATFASGDQIQISVSGVGRNNSGAVYLVGYIARILNGPNLFDIGGPGQVPSNAAEFAFTTTINFSVSVPGATGQYVPATGVTPRASASQLSMTTANTGIALTGTSTTIISDATAASAFGTNIGGVFLIGATPNGSAIYSNRVQLILDASQPIDIRVWPLQGNAPTGANSYYQVNAGYILGM